MKNKKIIILGAILAAFLMLMTPCISAVNIQASKELIEEKTSEFLQIVNKKNHNKILPSEELNLFIRIAGIILVFGCMFGNAAMFILIIPLWLLGVDVGKILDFLYDLGNQGFHMLIMGEPLPT